MKFSKAGFDVETVSDGMAAWDAVQREKPSLLVSDSQMPRMGGIELVRRLRADPETSDLPIILLTAKGYEFDQESIQNELWLSHIVLKPFCPRELLMIVSEILGPAALATDCVTPLDGRGMPDSRLNFVVPPAASS